MAIREIPFVKYAAYGNNFIIVDETVDFMVPEAEKGKFAIQASHTGFGIGADGVIFLQNCQIKILKEIHQVYSHGYNATTLPLANWIFRIFEPDGSESLSCGNGLLCIAKYVYDRHGLKQFRIATEIPTGTPNVIRLGTSFNKNFNHINMGTPRSAPEQIVDRRARIPFKGTVDQILPLQIAFRQHDLKPFTETTHLLVKAYLTFTGEPHLVVFEKDGLEPDLGHILFAASKDNPSNGYERRINFGSWLIHHIGSAINRNFTHYFPQGVNVTFVRVVDQQGVLEYRCYERGINQETLACGTGTVAATHVARELALIHGNQVAVRPHRCRWFKPEATVMVEYQNGQLTLHGKPDFLCQGYFNYRPFQCFASKPEHSSAVSTDSQDTKSL